MTSPTDAGKVEWINVYMLRVMAIFLIVNRHMGHIYPNEAYAVGGYLGNSLFYFVSAVGLSLSRSSELPYTQWLKKRFINLLLPIVILLALVELDPRSTLSIVADLLIPHKWSQASHFFPNLVVLYLFFWPLSKLTLRQLAVVLAVVAAIPHAVLLCFPDAVHASRLSLALTFFSVSAWMNFLAGMVVARLLAKGWFNGSSIAGACCGAAGVLVCFVLHHVLGKNSSEAVRLAVLHVNLLTVLLLFYSTELVNRLSARSFAAVSAKGLALLSLPVYVIHFEVIRWVVPMGINPFFKVGLVFVASFTLAKIFDIFYSRIRDVSRRILFSGA
jgi:hypothetical protein